MLDIAQAFRAAFGIEPTADAFMRLRRMLKDRSELHLILEALHFASHHAESYDALSAAVCAGVEFAQTNFVIGTSERDAILKEAEKRRADAVAILEKAMAAGQIIPDAPIDVETTNFFGVTSHASRTKH